MAFGVVYNNARISLAERARELATLRVIGFSRREVGAVLVTELVLLALIAVPIGLAVGNGLCHGDSESGEHRDSSFAAGLDARTTTLCRADRDSGLHLLGVVRPAPS